ncbi:Fe(3+)-hydroxamate ABC transporter permease FhuB [Chimaeribacter arupi]|uniref:Fe(3+)-hydroxamate ABC transporter permease FhuB n=2 Tax=Yersiniaceae TaxID=1903411 RepID=A0A2N5EKC2_9GAMM|nr:MULTISPECIES: Fe(3+)-hydroxamate ABC transporter permease FhuB [Yersiniaceae]MBS0968941.1 Fe(3+)-hydroxamate ABC transporter permease FhuB [Nissabacter archeti]MDV5138874.1 Fe(3+)-hydroxamate ABC transporter permease FhuB [Chimaeribacter arupi]PLR33238.1 Fe(3+)-hydroxamate ABC transporter permease FhuB [Chimaeribacter arupi]PLR44236.1 Fe(3+)-hydroxamate ABC transporter permease FhuB [Chimaeribacter arupi]PLR46774.1 Fe(3+)-hydroxamate ABC transporter permease FhuB [Chimaeribacter arupi]
MSRRFPAVALLTFGLLIAACLALSGYNLRWQLPLPLWPEGFLHPDVDDVRQMVFHYSLLPRIVVALLAGAGLALAGVLFQQVLRNPLAEPATLGVSAGAQLGLAIVTLWPMPGGTLTQQFAAMAGALLVGVLVFGVAWGKRMSPVTLILAGLVLSLYCGAVNGLLALFNYDQLQSLFLWSSGALNQQDWHIAGFLWPRLVLALVLALLLLRPMTLLGLDDGIARNLGLGLSAARLGALGVAIVLSAQIVNAVGVIGFVGLFSPLLATLLGARRLVSRVLLAPLLGALLLWLTDQIMLWLSHVWQDVPTGAATALVGAPLLLWLLPRLRHRAAPPPMAQGGSVPAERRHLSRWIAGGLLCLLAGLWVALAFGRDMNGWVWAHGDLFTQLLPWRMPRVMAALAAGVMLGAAGTLMQKLTGNPMASPEVLGISSGAAFGVVLMLFLVPGDAFGWLLPAGSLGAAGTLLIIMLVAARGNFSPARMLLAGIGLSTAFTTLITLLMASGDPRMGRLLTWISGSTYSVTPEQAWHSALMGVLLLALAPFCRRWLVILPLGSATSRSVGLALAPTRLVILLLAAVMTAVATLTIGPLSFVGLMAPHMARMMGFRRALPQLVMASLLGGMLMMLADWGGRMLLFPNQIPAGLLATFIGAPYFIYLLRKQAA